jgi:hypothetical protein
VFTNVLQEMLNIVYGAIQYLPDVKISIGIALALLLLIYFKGAVGGLAISILVTIFIADSFFSEGDLYQMTMERAVAGMTLGFFAFFVNLYFIMKTLADWKD